MNNPFSLLYLVKISTSWRIIHVFQISRNSLVYAVARHSDRWHVDKKKYQKCRGGKNKEKKRVFIAVHLCLFFSFMLIIFCLFLFKEEKEERKNDAIQYHEHWCILFFTLLKKRNLLLGDVCISDKMRESFFSSRYTIQTKTKKNSRICEYYEEKNVFKIKKKKH